jgi:hypothetical protein
MAEDRDADRHRYYRQRLEFWRSQGLSHADAVSNAKAELDRRDNG